MKKLIAVIASLSLAAALVSCGTAEDSSSQAKKVSSKAEQTSEIVSSQAEEEPQAEPVEEDPSEESQELDESEAEPEPEPADTFAGVTFKNSAGEEVTYEEAASSGLAAAADDGSAYCFVADGAGAGSVFYKVFYTEDGQEWKETDAPLRVLNGRNSFWSCEDGTIVGFEFRTAESRAYPKAVVYSFDKATHSVSAQEFPDVFNSVTDAAGNPLTDQNAYDFEVAANPSGREFECRFYDLDGNLFADDVFAIQ